MDKPLKPRSGNFSGFLSRFFRTKKVKAANQPGQNTSNQATTNAQQPAADKPLVDPFLRFRNLSNTGQNSSTTTGRTTPRPTANPPFAHFVEEPVRETPPPTLTAQPTPQTSPKKPFFQLSKTLPAFWTVASLMSFTMNVVLLVALVLVARELFVLKALVGNNLLGGLYENFIYMDQAHIRTNITVENTIPINFTLPISQDTTVVLTQKTPIYGANVTINTGGISINSPANIVLPAGTTLPVHLELQVPVSANVPVKLNVPVDIPLEQTDLHKPFIGLQQVVSPFYYMLQPQIKTPQDLPLCWPNPSFCAFFFQQ